MPAVFGVEHCIRGTLLRFGVSEWTLENTNQSCPVSTMELGRNKSPRERWVDCALRRSCGHDAYALVYSVRVSCACAVVFSGSMVADLAAYGVHTALLYAGSLPCSTVQEQTWSLNSLFMCCGSYDEPIVMK